MLERMRETVVGGTDRDKEGRQMGFLLPEGKEFLKVKWSKFSAKNNNYYSGELLKVV